MPATAASALVALVRHPDGRVEEVGADRLEEIDRLAAVSGALVWVSSSSPSDGDIEVLRDEFDLHALAIEDLHKRHQRPKMDAYESQHMVVAYEVAEAAATGLSEIHIFIGTGWLLTVSWDETPLLDSVRRRFGAGTDRAGTDVGELLYSILDGVVDSYFPELDRLSERID